MKDILVTGATGNVGRELIALLSAAGAPVRALTRDAGAATGSSATGTPDGVTLVGGDLAVPGSLEQALAGSETVFLIWPFLTADGAPAVLDAIARHARRVVYLSSSAVRDGTDRQTDPIARLHADMERLIEKTGLERTVLRADTLASNARGWAAQIRATHLVRGPGAAATAVVHERDVAAVAAHVLAGDGHTGATHVLTGPEVLTRAEQVQLLGEAIGQPLRFHEVPAEAARAQLLADGRPPALVEALLAAAARPASHRITTTVEDITGAPARTFRTWAEEHAADFR